MYRSIMICLMLVGAVLLSGCSMIDRYNPFPERVFSTPPAGSDQPAPRTASTSPRRGLRPYTINGVTYHPLQSARGYNEVGTASWYGRDFHGRLTANGETYDMYGISAAHKTLPLGTRVRVTNIENGRTVTLVINDRGPFVDNRIIDLSYGAARQLDMADQGLARVRVIALDDPVQADTRVLAQASAASFAVQVGSFSVHDNARRTYDQLVRAGYSDASIERRSSGGRDYHVVRAGSFASRDQAEAVMRRLKPQYPSCFITS